MQEDIFIFGYSGIPDSLKKKMHKWNERWYVFHYGQFDIPHRLRKKKRKEKKENFSQEPKSLMMSYDKFNIYQHSNTIPPL